MSPKNQLRLIFWEVTSGCNLRCIHCRATAKPERSPDELTTQEALGMIDSLASLANPILILTGGEPLYRPDIFEIASYATGKGLRVALATNGTLVTQDVACEIKRAGIRRVSISLDGARAITHDSFRGLEGSFDRAIEGFENLKRLGVSLQINTTVVRHNVAELSDMLDLCVGLGADAFHIFLLVPVGCGLEISDEQEISPEEYERVLNWFYDQQFKVGGLKMELKATCAPHYFRIMRQRARRDGVRIKPETHGMAAVTRGCLAGTGVCFLSHSGKVQPCGYLPVAAGDIRRSSFKEIWGGSEVFQSLRNFGNLKGKCGVCEYRMVCGGCRARAYARTGDYLDEEPYCVYEPRV